MKNWLKTRLIWKLCDLHTLLDLAQFRVHDWLERLDPTFPVDQFYNDQTETSSSAVVLKLKPKIKRR